MDCEGNILAEFHHKLDIINLTQFISLQQDSLLYVLIKRKMVYCICTTKQSHDKCCWVNKFLAVAHKAADEK